MNSFLINSLDKSNSRNDLQRGENGHVELGWSNNIRERIVQFYYQLVRTDNFKKIDSLYTNLIIDTLTENITQEEQIEYITILYKLIAYTRDILFGKGEYALSYVLVASWAKLQSEIHKTNLEEELKTSDPVRHKKIQYLFSKQFYIKTNKIAFFALENFIVSINKDHPIGSFKDVKYFINYWDSLWNGEFSRERYMNAEIIKQLIALMNSQLRNDILNIHNYDDNALNARPNISLVSKWIPREKSKFGWMTKHFAKQYFSHENWFETADTDLRHSSAEKKALTNYRKLVSKANAFIDTTQIKQCNGSWKHINFDKNVTSITLSKQKQAFMNKTRNGKIRYPENNDRNECSENYSNFIRKCVSGDSKIKGKRVSIYDFVKDALSVDDSEREICDTINLQWKDNSVINNSFNHLIAMVDTSSSMSSDNNTPLYNAVGLGIRIAERSTLGKRVLTFNDRPEWFNLDTCVDFVSCVKKIQTAPWGTNTNFYSALEKILEAYVVMDLHPNDVEKYGLIILSDMQIDCCVCDYKQGQDEMFQEIENRFARVGMNSRFNVPYKTPFIVFWNLRKTDGFPTSVFTKNVAMISGYSPALLNQFLNKGLDAFKEFNSWDIMNSAMMNKRYDSYDNAVKLLLNDL